MGSELKREIANNGGIPMYDENMTEAEIIEAGFNAYKEIGEIPPPVKEVIEKINSRRAQNNGEKK